METDSNDSIDTASQFPIGSSHYTYTVLTLPANPPVDQLGRTCEAPLFLPAPGFGIL